MCDMYPAVLLHLPSLWYLCLGIFQRKMLTLYLLSPNTLVCAYPVKRNFNNCEMYTRVTSDFYGVFF